MFYVQIFLYLLYIRMIYCIKDYDIERTFIREMYMFTIKKILN